MMRPPPKSACILCVVLSCLLLPAQGQNSKKSEILRSFTSEVNLIRYARFRGQPLLTKEAHMQLNRQAKWDKAELPDASGLGSRLRFVKIDPQATPGGAVPVRYRVYAEGTSQDKVFALNTWLVDDTLTIDSRDFYVNGQGLVMTRRPRPDEESIMKAPGDELEVVSGKGVGEPIRFVLTSRDGQSSVYGTLVERPIVSYDRECILEIRIAQPNSTAALVIADGFPGKAKVPLVLESDGEIANDVLETNADGHAVLGVLTIVPGKVDGTLKASAEGHNCLPSVLLPWSEPAKFEAHPEHPGQ